MARRTSSGPAQGLRLADPIASGAGAEGPSEASSELASCGPELFGEALPPDLVVDPAVLAQSCHALDAP